MAGSLFVYNIWLWRRYWDCPRLEPSVSFDTAFQPCFAQTLDIAHRWLTEKAFVLSIEVRGIVITQKPWIVPIPGSRSLHRLEENIGAVDIELTSDDLSEIKNAMSQITVIGNRY